MNTPKNVNSRKHEIIKASVELFYKYGYQKASLRDIARKVGISQAAIYYHFKTKEEILLNIIEKYSNKLLFSLKTCFVQKKDPIENLRDAIFAHATSIRNSRNGTKIIIEDKRFLSDEIKQIVKEKEIVIFLLYKDYLKQLQDLKLIKQGDLSIATFGILGTVNWLYHWFNPDKAMTMEKIAEEMIDNLLYGLINK
ncbi:MAG: TetR/AcrR family transcriptional regulator [Desulfobacterales bacterium]|jgi:AcrR family transcriptional regulator|nr:TetR/AcrR family transcriptional regulator [Desulfobacterales bacterium]|tara:strand:- start:36 stop:623 length:588 start_codon:yes stop_codon:yes gene_type:complete